MTDLRNGPLPGFELLHACPDTGARHLRIPLCDRARPAVYVGHPITGIGMGRILAMQDEVTSLFGATANPPALFFPMRSTHLGPDGTGANEYDPGAGPFSHPRHFTAQNRCDAVYHADGVLLHYDIRDDAGAYRLSRGIPFDLGWARAHGKPVVAVIAEGNPNLWPGLAEAADVHVDLSSAITALAALLPADRPAREACHVEILDFPGDAVSLGLLARLAEADARKGLGTCAAVLAILPGGRDNPNWHGQVGEVADWILQDLASAARVCGVLRGGRA